MIEAVSMLIVPDRTRPSAYVRTPSTMLANASSPTARLPRRSIAQSRTRKVDFEVMQDKNHILASQRLNRPVAPHLSIYRPQINSFLSISMRITGSFMSGSMYLFGFFYLLSPTLGIDMSSAALASAFASWPVIVQVASKFVVAFPFTLHIFGSLRYVAFTFAQGIKSNVNVVKVGWTVLALAVTTALGLATLM
ncbi:hypothetical protein AC579_1677 [Pseudocercospora musae]|uniref:Uncharacterized protein n=1 Tax=Pseudocercospora musae TaxID=113226 RepID=A0A139I966_9PEZI|nr:hypothetical protein AC579_1677 [Pseudocercospora musae]